ADPEKEQLFYDTIRTVCQKIAEEGFEEDQLEGALNRAEFRMREGNQSSLPTGLLYMMSVVSGVKRGIDPFAQLKIDEIIDSVRAAVRDGYLKELVRDIFLEETHVLQYVMQPDAELAKRRELEEQERSKRAWLALDASGKQKLIDAREGLLAYQAKEETKEALSSIPMLSIADIKRTTEPYPYQITKIDTVTTQVYHAVTKGIAYMQLLFPLDRVRVDELPYVGMLMELLGSLDTTKHTYAQLTHEIDKNTGGIWMSPGIYNSTEEGCDPYYVISLKCLYPKLERALDLALEQIQDTVFDDKERILEVLREMLASRESRLNGDGDELAASLALGHFDHGQVLQSRITGFSFTDRLRELLGDFDQQIDDMIATWKHLIQVVFARERMLVHYTADEKEDKFIRETVSSSLIRLPERSTRMEKAERPPLDSETLGIMTPSMVQYVSMAVRFPQVYTGKMQVLRSILSGEYLWHQIRELGGAYGCRIMLTRRRLLTITSFRDSHLMRSRDIYFGAEAYVRGFDIDEREFSKYIIGTISRLSQPMSVSAKSSAVVRFWLDGVSDEDRQRTRTEILETTQEDIRAMADVLHVLKAQGSFCVVGNSAKIRENKAAFDKIRPAIAGDI
ncbi:MAG: hypothetical protein K6A77_08140, partial [Clostridiales bacterium]|nr:hypothetical protein [Clostridiales bacterium]